MRAGNCCRTTDRCASTKWSIICRSKIRRRRCARSSQRSKSIGPTCSFRSKCASLSGRCVAIALSGRQSGSIAVHTWYKDEHAFLFELIEPIFRRHGGPATLGQVELSQGGRLCGALSAMARSHGRASRTGPGGPLPQRLSQDGAVMTSRRAFTRRNVLVGAGALAAAGVLLSRESDHGGKHDDYFTGAFAGAARGRDRPAGSRHRSRTIAGEYRCGRGYAARHTTGVALGGEVTALRATDRRDLATARRESLHGLQRSDVAGDCAAAGRASTYCWASRCRFRRRVSFTISCSAQELTSQSRSG